VPGEARSLRQIVQLDSTDPGLSSIYNQLVALNATMLTMYNLMANEDGGIYARIEPDVNCRIIDVIQVETVVGIPLDVYVTNLPP